MTARTFDVAKEFNYHVFRGGKHDYKPLRDVVKEDRDYVQKLFSIKSNEAAVFKYALDQLDKETKEKETATKKKKPKKEVTEDTEGSQEGW